jgi:hypothetical protein
VSIRPHTACFAEPILDLPCYPLTLLLCPPSAHPPSGDNENNREMGEFTTGTITKLLTTVTS